PGALEGLGGLVAEGMGSAVHIGVVAAVVVADGVDHRQRLLGGGGVVQVHQGVAVDLPLENGKVAAHRVDIEGLGRGCGAIRGQCFRNCLTHRKSLANSGSWPNRAASCGCRWWRRGSCWMRLRISLIKPKLNRARASWRGMPRVSR